MGEQLQWICLNSILTNHEITYIYVYKKAPLPRCLFMKDQGAMPPSFTPFPVSLLRGGQTFSMQGHIENFIATGGRIYHIYNRFENFSKNFLH